MRAPAMNMIYVGKTKDLGTVDNSAMTRSLIAKDAITKMNPYHAFLLFVTHHKMTLIVN